MDHKITKRIATQADTEFARNVHHVSYHDLVVRQYGTWDQKLQDEFFEDDWKPQYFEIISYNGEPAGYCSTDYKPDHIFISELVILPEFQGKGIGTEILKELIQEAKVKNVFLKLRVSKMNRAHNLYRRIGFKDISSDDTHIEMEWRP